MVETGVLREGLGPWFITRESTGTSGNKINSHQNGSAALDRVSVFHFGFVEIEARMGPHERSSCLARGQSLGNESSETVKSLAQGGAVSPQP